MNDPKKSLTAFLRAARTAWRQRFARYLMGILSSEASVLPSAVPSGQADWSSRDVLVGSLRSQAQFTICLKKQFYYIPAALIQEALLPIRYVALFRTPRVFGSHAGIQYYGAVCSMSLVRRSAIRAVPMREGADPNAMYYLFRIQQWNRLPRVILPRENAFVNEFTNLFLLQNAEYVPELLLQSKEEYRIYSELKRRVIASSITEYTLPPVFEAEGCRFLFSEAEIQLEKDGAVLERFRIGEFAQSPYAVFRRMMLHLGK